ncbi:MAG: hypothetical protein AAF658_07660, partial [Myxococcota bacterium]
PEEARKILLSSFDEVMGMLEGKKWTIKDLDAQVQEVTKELVADIEVLRDAIGKAKTAHPAIHESSSKIDGEVETLFLKSFPLEAKRSEAADLLTQIRELKGAGADASEVSFAQKQLSQLAAEHSDGRFNTNRLSELATPKARALAESGKIAADAKDVIAAKEDSFDPAFRILGDSDRLIDLTDELRDIMLPKVGKTRERIELPTAWVDTGIDTLSGEASRISGIVAQQAVGEAIDALQLERVRFRQLVSSIAKLDEQRRTDSPVRIDKAQLAVDDARKKLTSALDGKVDAKALETRLLREKDHNTDESLAAARKSLEDSVPHLTKGDVEKGDAALDVVNEQSALTHSIVERSLESASTHEGRLTRAREQRSDIETRVLPDRSDVLAALKVEYASNTWNGVRDAVKNANAHLRTSNASEKRAETNFAAVRLIAASGNLSGLESEITNALDTLNAITTLQSDLRKQDSANDDAIRSLIRGKLAKLETLADSRKTLGTSSTAADKLEIEVSQLRSRLDRRGRDPKALNSQIAGLKGEVDSLTAVIIAEHAAYDRAADMIRKADNWRTSESVSRSDYPDVSRAKRLLRQGRYAEAYREAKSEFNDAESAERRAYNARRERERAAAAAAAAAASSSSSSSSSGSSSSSFGGGSGSSSSTW